MRAVDLQQRFEEIRSNKAFELFIIAIIVISALVVGVKTYDLPESVIQIITALDFLVTLIFVVEDRKSVV